eukprot:g26591.t1
MVFDPKTEESEPFGDGKVHGLVPIVQTPSGTFVSGAGLRSTDRGKSWKKISDFPDIHSQGWRHEMVSLGGGIVVASQILGPGFGGERIRYVISRDDGVNWDDAFEYYNPGRAINGRACPRTIRLDKQTIGVVFYDIDKKQPGGPGLFFMRIPFAEFAAATSDADAKPASPRLGQGLMTGEVSHTSAVVQARLTGTDRLVKGDVPGRAGQALFVLRESVPNESSQPVRKTAIASADNDFIARVKFSELDPNTRYTVTVHAGDDLKTPTTRAVGSFKTLPGPEYSAPVRFVVVTGMNYAKFHGDNRIDKKIHKEHNNTALPKPYTGPDKHLGYPGLASILKLKPDFFVGTGDNVYYDTPKKPRAETIAEMRQKWHEQFVQPRYRDLFASVPTFWEIDDHDYRIDDGDNTGDYRPSPALGRKVMLEQLPIAPHGSRNARTYRTRRVSKDLQIWFTEGRMYRSPNTMKDGPDKSIWGAKQKLWLKRSLMVSDARFKLLISPTPMIGPDDSRKTDNHTNIGGFQHERDEFFKFLKDTGIDKQGFYLVCGDRHWQYHARHPSGIEEFSCGALVDANSRLGRKPGDPKSTDPKATIKQLYAQKVRSGGFLQIGVTPATKTKPAKLTFQWFDEFGKLLHQHVKSADVLVNMMMLVILIGGGIFAFTLVKEIFPESRPNKLAIMAVYPGVQPQEVEKAVTIKVEEAVRDVDGIEKVDSTVQEGISTTVLTLFNEVKNVDVILQEVQANVDALQDLPDDVEKVTVRKLEPRLPVISVAIFGDGTEAQLKRAARQMRDDLLLLHGVTDVQITGTREDEISVEVRPDRLIKYNVTFEEIAAAIRESNLDVSGGQLKGNRSSVAVRTLGEKLRGRDLENIVVRSRPDGSKVFLRDVATVHDAFVESDLEAYFNGKRAVNCTVYKTGKQDALEIATLVRAYVAGKTNADFDPYGINAAYDEVWYWKPFAIVGSHASKFISSISHKVSKKADPLKVYEESRAAPFDHNFKVAMHTNLARFIEGRLDLLTRNGKSGLVLVLISLMLFLNWRVAFWAAIGLPVSFLGTFIVMWFLGATINLLTLFGLIIVLGIIVDDAIIIGENIFRHVEEGLPPMQAAVKGAEEVMWPVTVAVATTIAAFAPMFFVRGQIGDFMSQLPIVVLAALSVSLIEALLILPAHLAHLPKKKLEKQRSATGRREGRARFVDRFRRLQQSLGMHHLMRLYERFLRLTLEWRYVTLATSVALIFVCGGMLKGQVVKQVFVQEMDSETLICSLEMPVGTTADLVKDRLGRLVRLVNDKGRVPEVVNVQSFVARQYDLTGAGATGTADQSHLGQLVIELKPADEREEAGERSSLELLKLFRSESEKLAGVNSVTWLAMSGGPGGKDIHIRIDGDSFTELGVVAGKIKAALLKIKGVHDLDDDIDRGKREVQLQLRPGAREAGISVNTLGAHVRSAVFGRESRRITRNREDVKIMVRYPESYRATVHDLESMWIPTSPNPQDRKWSPLGQIARVNEAESYSSIHRSQQRHAVSVFGEVDEELGTSTTTVLETIRKEFDKSIRKDHPQVRIEFLGSHEERIKAFGGLWTAMPVALLIIYMLLAGLFRSYMQPVVVMSAIPFGFLGAVAGHWVTGYPMTILSWIGLLALTGIVVNDSLVLVSFINNRVRDGEDEFEASVKGAKLRLRAIMLTTLTTARHALLKINLSQDARMSESYILAGARTPIGKFLGAFQHTSATELGAVAISAAMERAAVSPNDVDEVIMGNVVSSGLRQAPARQAALKAGLPDSIAAVTVNKVCGSGLKAVMLADQAIRAGDARTIVAGGMENMSRIPHLLIGARDGWKLGDATMHDALIHDGLWCAFDNCHMGMHAEYTATENRLTREEMDEFSAESQKRAARAIAEGDFADEIAPVTVRVKREEIAITADEGPRPDTTAEGLGKLRPAFDPNGLVTAGNASMLSDGAAALVVADAATAAESDAPWKARILASQTAGTAPRDLFIAPVHAVRQVLDKARLSIGDIDLFEINEAFASQMLACIEQLKLDPAKVNVNGGAIALGHPIGASGARILVTLLAALKRRDLKRGLATLCLGGGNAVAMLIERC